MLGLCPGPDDDDDDITLAQYSLFARHSSKYFIYNSFNCKLGKLRHFPKVTE